MYRYRPTAKGHRKMLETRGALVCLLVLFVTVCGANELTLRQLNVVFRHGDRMPESFPKRFPNDPNMRSSLQPFGSGGLTNEGKLRMYRLGEWLRTRYGDSIGAYNESRLFAASSSTSRTKMSLQLVLAALYPPTGSLKWHPTLDWQPIPTHHTHFRHDKIFNRDKCQIFMDELGRVRESREVRKKVEGYKKFMDELRGVVGKKTPIRYDDVLILHNNLEIERRLNMSMEPWMTELLNGNRLADLRRLNYEILGYNQRLRRLDGGYLLRRINEDMLRARNDASKDAPATASLYSGHDKNIISLLKSLKLHDSHFPEFGSALIFELWSRDGQYFVKILYHLGIPEDFQTLVVPGCVALCSLDDFTRLTKEEQTLDEDVDCEIKIEKYFNDSD